MLGPKFAKYEAAPWRLNPEFIHIPSDLPNLHPIELAVPIAAKETFDLPEFVASFKLTPKISNAVSIRRIAPVYPPLAKERGIGGTTILTATISELGEVGAIRVFKSAGDPQLDQAAIEALKDWEFQPATRDGEPVQSEIQVPIAFQLP